MVFWVWKPHEQRATIQKHKLKIFPPLLYYAEDKATS